MRDTEGDINIKNDIYAMAGHITYPPASGIGEASVPCCIGSYAEAQAQSLVVVALALVVVVSDCRLQVHDIVGESDGPEWLRFWIVGRA